MRDFDESNITAAVIARFQDTHDVQRPELSEAALRARFRSDAQGCFHFWSIMPKFYPIPDDGPVGQMAGS
jgi:hydroxyquinol 1,2-dioxygenase